MPPKSGKPIQAKTFSIQAFCSKPFRYLLTKRMVKEGGIIPRGYLIAYCDFDTGTYITYPIGIHYIVKKFHDFMYWIRSHKRGYREKIEQEAYDMGRARGREEGYTQGLIIGAREEQERMMSNLDNLLNQALVSKSN